MQLTIFDVEHGQCALLTCDNGRRLMIDCGHNVNTSWRPGSYLASIGVRHLDMLAITNYDEDHVSGLVNLLENVTVGTWLRNPTVSSQTLMQLKTDTGGAGPGIRRLASVIGELGPAVDEPAFPGALWSAFWNRYPHFEDENNLSMVVHLQLNGLGFLFPGDLESAGWKNLLETVPEFRDAVRNTAVLLASHHGRENGVYAPLFDNYECRPKLVVVSDDYHQYDTQMTTQYYASKCSGVLGFRGNDRWVLTTRNDGALTFTFGALGGCTVT